MFAGGRDVLDFVGGVEWDALDVCDEDESGGAVVGDPFMALDVHAAVNANAETARRRGRINPSNRRSS